MLIRFSSIVVVLLTMMALGTSRELTSQEESTLQLRSDLVLVPVEVTNKKSGLPVEGLKKEDFVLLEDGAPQEIRFLARDDFPLSILLLVELTFIKDAARGARTALSRLRPEDEAALMVFNGEPHLIHGFTRDKDSVIQRLEEIEEYGMAATHLHRATYEAANYLLESTDRARRRVLIVITRNLGEAGSREEIKKSERKVLDRLYQSDIVVCGIIIGYDPPRVFHLHPILRFARIDEFVKVTSGKLAKALPREPVRAHELVKLIDHLRAQYVLGYVPTNTARDGRVRKIKVALSSSAEKKYKGVQLRHRTGYIVPDLKEGGSK